jgi:hypothetical protein
LRHVTDVRRFILKKIVSLFFYVPRTRKRRTAESAAPKNAAPEAELSAASGLTSGSATCDTSSSEEVFFEASLDDFEDIDAVLQRHISGTISDKIRGGGFPYPDHVIPYPDHVVSISGSHGFHIWVTWFPYPNHVVLISRSRGFHIRDHMVSISGSRGFHIRIMWFPKTGSHGFHIRITWFPYPDHVVSISGSRDFHIRSRGFHIRINRFPYPDHVVSNHIRIT